MYLSTPEEVDTSEIVEVSELNHITCYYCSVKYRTSSLLESTFVARFSGSTTFYCRRCYIPRVEGSNMTMLRVASMDDLHSLSHKQWGITQPSGR